MWDELSESQEKATKTKDKVTKSQDKITKLNKDKAIKIY